MNHFTFLSLLSILTSAPLRITSIISSVLEFYLWYVIYLYRLLVCYLILLNTCDVHITICSYFIVNTKQDLLFAIPCVFWCFLQYTSSFLHRSIKCERHSCWTVEFTFCLHLKSNLFVLICNSIPLWLLVPMYFLLSTALTAFVRLISLYPAKLI